MSEPTLTEFLLARIAEDEAAARKAAGSGEGKWERGMYPLVIDGDDGMVIYDEGGHTKADAKHIIRWDPARVLAECAAKRRIVELHEAAVNHDEMCGWPCETLLALAAVYADHPEFLESWRG